MAIQESSREILLKTMGQGNETQLERTAFDQSARAASQASSGQPSFTDSMDNAIAGMKQAYAGIAKQKQKLMTEQTKLELRKELMSNSAVQELIKLRGELSKKAVGFNTRIEGSADIDPAVQRRANMNDLARLVGGLSDVTGDIETRGTGIQSILDSMQKGKQQEYDIAKDQYDASRNMVSDLMGVGRYRMEEAKSPYELQKLQAETSKLQTEALAKGNGTVVPGDSTTLSNEAKAVLINPDLFSETGYFTPTKRQEVLKELVSYGASPETLKLLTANFSDKTRTELANFDALTNKAQGALDKLNAGTFGTGLIQSNINDAMAKTPMGAPPGWNDYAALIGITSAEQLKALTGVQFSEKEYDRLKPYLPQRNDQEIVAKDKLQNMISLTKKIYEERIANTLKSSLDFKNESGNNVKAGTTSSGIKWTIEP